VPYLIVIRVKIATLRKKIDSSAVKFVQKFCLGSAVCETADSLRTKCAFSGMPVALRANAGLDQVEFAVQQRLTLCSSNPKHVVP